MSDRGDWDDQIEVEQMNDVDPSGLDGERHVRDDSKAPYVVELYSYLSHVSLDAIRAAWLTVLPLGSMAGFKEEGVRGGRRLVKIDRLERISNARPCIEEPDV